MFKKILLSVVAVAVFAVAPTTFAAHEDVAVNLGVGSRGADVVTIQGWLEKEGYLVMPAGVAKGYFGPITRAALAAYQRDHGITPASGNFGPITRAHIDAKVAAEATMQAPAPNPNTKAADLRVALNSLMKEHVVLGLDALRHAYDGSNKFDASLATLDENSVAIAAAVGSVYGAEAEGQFLALWREHIDFFANYTVGLATNDEEKKNLAKVGLEGYRAEADAFFSGANPHIPQGAVAGLAHEHGMLIIASMDAYAAGDYALSYDKWKEAYDQVGSIADALAGGIVTQFPQLF